MKLRLLKAGAGGSLLLLTLLLPKGDLQSCGPDPYESSLRIGLFNASIGGSPSLEPFYYAERFLNSTTPDPAGVDYRRNCEEWRAHTGGRVAAKDIYEIQYKRSPDDFVYAANTGNWSGFGENGFAKWLREPAHRQDLAYFTLAKQIEFEQLGNRDPWKESGWSYDLPASPDSLVAKALAGCYRTKDTFLQQRYAFQATKLLYYPQQEGSRREAAYDSGRAVYERLLLNKKSVVADWGLLYYANMLQDSMAATAAMVRTFSRSEEKKVYVYNHVRSADLQALIARSDDRFLRASAGVLLALKNPGRAMPQLEQVFADDPANPYLPMLVTREVNKVEDWLWTRELLGFYPSLKSIRYENEKRTRRGDNYDYKEPDTGYAYYAVLNARKDRQYCQDLTTFLARVSGSQPSLRSFATLAGIHLSNVNKDFEKAAVLLKDLPVFPEPAWEQQRLIEQVICTAHTKDLQSAATQELFARNIHALEGLGLRYTRHDNAWGYLEWDGVSEAPASMETMDDLRELLLLLSHCYEDSGDFVRSGLLYQKADLLTTHYDGGGFTFSGLSESDTARNVFYSDIAYFDRRNDAALVDRVLAFRHRKDLNAFDRMLLPRSALPDAFLLDLKGTILFRDGRYAEAESVFGKMPDSFWEDEYDYSYLPKTDIGSVGSLIPGERAGGVVYTVRSKKLIARDMRLLQDAITAGGTVATRAALLYRMGNAVYNTSFAGKAWMMFSYGKSGNEPASFDSDGAGSYGGFFINFPTLERRYRDRYYRCIAAMEYYRNSYRLCSGVNPELAARCLLMLAHCDKLRAEVDASSIPYSTNGIGRYREPADLPVSGYLRQLKDRSGNTELFELAATECPDVAEYLK